MKRLALFAILIAVVLLSSCAPMRISTSMLKKYPPLENNAPVEVFFQASEVPNNSEVMGLVSTSGGNGTASNKCDSISVTELLKEEARKVGGNAILVTQYTKPVSQSSCHQMSGQILNIYDVDLIGQRENDEATYVFESGDKRLLPAFRIKGGIGFGWRMTDDDTGDPATDLIYKDIKSGLGYEGSFTYYIVDNHGIGFYYSGYSANSDRFDLQTKSNLNHIGAEYVYRNAYLENKLLLNMGVGLGYADYKIRYEYDRDFAEESGHTVGFNFSLNLDYMITNNLAAGITLSTNSGVVTTIVVNDNGHKETYKTNDSDNGIGLGRLNLLLGLSYYF